MKIRNSTYWPALMLRRMVSWCCKQIGLPVRSVKIAEFGIWRSGALNGHGCPLYGHVRIVIGPPSAFPVHPGRKSGGFLSPMMADQLESLIAVTARELSHLQEHRENSGRPYSELRIQFDGRRTLDLFCQQRESLLLEWGYQSSENILPVINQGGVFVVVEGHLRFPALHSLL